MNRHEAPSDLGADRLETVARAIYDVDDNGIPWDTYVADGQPTIFRDYADAALKAIDDHDTRTLADLLVERYGKDNVVGVVRDPETRNQFEWLVAVVEHNLRQRLAAAVEAMRHPTGYHSSGMTPEEAALYCGACDHYTAAARIIRERP